MKKELTQRNRITALGSKEEGGVEALLVYCLNLHHRLGCCSYGNCSKISNTFLYLFSIKMLVFRAGIHKMLLIIANREDPDQTASSEAV